MFIGQVGMSQYFRNMNVGQKRANILHVQLQAAVFNQDKAEIGIHSGQDDSAGIYRPAAGQVRKIDPVPYTQLEPDESLKRELLPPSERAGYTEEDALVKQYMKQYRIEGHIYVDERSVHNSSEPLRLILPDQIAREDLERLRSELDENGLGTEIDWRGVESDFVQIGIGFGNVERFEQKADYVASRYAVLKDRIESQFTGEKKESEMQKLEQLYTAVKEEMADSYADSIGGFYESLGQSGAAQDMRGSVLAAIDAKADAYTSYLAQTDLASLAGTDKQWLKQDDAYMAEQLRKNAASLSEPQKQAAGEQAPYSTKDLAFAGAYAKELSHQLQDPDWNVEESDAALGRYFAERYEALKTDIEKAGVSSKLSDMLKASFDPFTERFMDSLDARIDSNRERVAERPWLSGLIRTEYIDRDKVNSN